MVKSLVRNFLCGFTTNGGNGSPAGYHICLDPTTDCMVIGCCNNACKFDLAHGGFCADMAAPDAPECWHAADVLLAVLRDPHADVIAGWTPLAPSVTAAARRALAGLERVSTGADALRRQLQELVGRAAAVAALTGVGSECSVTREQAFSLPGSCQQNVTFDIYLGQQCSHCI